MLLKLKSLDSIPKDAKSVEYRQTKHEGGMGWKRVESREQREEIRKSLGGKRLWSRTHIEDVRSSPKALKVTNVTTNHQR